MVTRANTVVYIAHSGKTYQVEARFSMLTLLARLESCSEQGSIVLYTDQPSLAVKDARVRVIPITPADLFRWAGRHSYIHRCKLEILRRAVDDVGLPFIFADTDTQRHAFPHTAFECLHAASPPNQKPPFYMWKHYGPIDDLPEYGRLLKKNTDILGRFGLVGSATYDMWNSGVIGVPIDAENIFVECLELTDRLSNRLERSKHIRCVEQIAVSLLAQDRFDLQSLQSKVDHYYRFMHLSRFVLRDFFKDLQDKSIEEQARTCAANLLTEERIASSRYVADWTGRLTARLGRSWKNKSGHARTLWMRLQRAMRTPRRLSRAD